MARRVWAFGAVFGVLAAALLSILAVLDVITAEQLREGLGRTLLAIGIATAALTAMLAIGRLGRPRSREAPRPGSPSAD